jgi:putative transposase
MPDFHRYRVPGGCYFFTANLLERRGNTLLTDRIDYFREAVQRVRRSRPFTIDAWVILPDHMHAVWTLPPSDDDFSTRWRLIKTFFVQALPKTERLSRVRRAKGERGIWQRRFWEHAIRDDEDYRAHVDYVHFNPVKHGLATSPAAWPFSTFRVCASRGLYSPDWNGSNIQNLPAGEPGE